MSAADDIRTEIDLVLVAKDRAAAAHALSTYDRLIGVEAGLRKALQIIETRKARS